MAERDIRRLTNSKGSPLDSDIAITRNSPEGSTNFTLSSNSQLAMVRKQRGKLWKTYLSSNGDQYVDRTLVARKIKFTQSFTDYKIFTHNFTDDIGRDAHYLPWGNYDAEGSDMDGDNLAIVTPFKMTLFKILIRPESISDSSSDISISVREQDNASATIDTVATATYSTDDLASNDYFELKQKDFDNSPAVDIGKKLGLFMQANADPGGSGNWWITSVWKTEIII